MKAQCLKGFRDLTPNLCGYRQNMLDALRQIANSSGFEEIDTPRLEYAETLLGQGGDTEKEIYRFKDHGDRDVALRFDLTVSFARFAAQNLNDLVLPFRKFQVGKVWRGEKPQKGRYREFLQADVDIIGIDHLSADLDILYTLCRMFDAVLPQSGSLVIGHRGLLSGIIKHHFGQVSAEMEREVLIILDKWTKIGAEKVSQMLLTCFEVELKGDVSDESRISQPKQMSKTSVEDFIQLMGELSGDDQTVLDHKIFSEIASKSDIPGFAQDLARFRQTMGQLEELRNRQSSADESKCRPRIDFKLARGLGYYTGIVFEAMIDGHESLGSIGAGGRYNDLASRFTSQSLPGIGGSVGVDRLVSVCEQLGAIDVAKQDLFIAVAGVEQRPYAYKIAEHCRNNGLSCQVGLQPKIDKQFRQADRLGVVYVAIVGDQEREQQTVTLKNLSTGTQETSLSLDALVQNVKTMKQG